MGLLGAATGAVLLAWLWAYVRPRPILALAFFFIFFQIVLRTISSMFLDAFGPVYAIELDYEVGGSGATVAWAATVVITVLIVSAFLSPRTISRGASIGSEGAVPGALTLGDCGFWAATILVCALYADMLSGGVIPLFEGLERWEYTEQYAGPVHRWFFEFGTLLVCMLGVLSVYPRVLGGQTDLRFVVLLGIIFVYCVLAGHRFSIFYAFGAYFLLPRAVLYMPGVPAPKFESMATLIVRRLLASSVARFLSLVSVIGLVGFALVNSLVNVRGLAPALALFSFAQRTFVQPQQMWFLTHERVLAEGQYDSADALNFIFDEAINPERNSTIQYLMVLALGERRAALIIEQGMNFAGGYPEIVFEIGGPYLGWLLVALMAVVTGALLREFLRAVYEGRLLSVFAVLYVLFAFFITYVGGMLNNLVAMTFWIKVAFMFVVLALERGSDGRPRPVLPWVLWAPRRALQS
jgi:hypothetical protein